LLVALAFEVDFGDHDIRQLHDEIFNLLFAVVLATSYRSVLDVLAGDAALIQGYGSLIAGGKSGLMSAPLSPQARQPDRGFRSGNQASSGRPSFSYRGACRARSDCDEHQRRLSDAVR
jgi:hypothetical protein